jgi:XisI protein
LLSIPKSSANEALKLRFNRLVQTEVEPITLGEITGYVFYNTADWTLKKLVKTASNNRQILEANFQAYLDGFSDNVKEIISKFELRNQIKKMVEADVLLEVLEKFTSPDINLSPDEALDPAGRKLPGLSNLGMGYVFEELVRKFNVEVQLIFDIDREHYQWMNVGWEGSVRVYRSIVHFDRRDGKIWLQQNLTNQNPAAELMEMGVAREDIILGLQPPYKRQYTDYGVA